MFVMTVVFCEGIRCFTLDRRVPKESPIREFSFRLPRREVKEEEILEIPRNK